MLKDDAGEGRKNLSETLMDEAHPEDEEEEAEVEEEGTKTKDGDQEEQTATSEAVTERPDMSR